jgi:hypothetical protein
MNVRSTLVEQWDRVTAVVLVVAGLVALLLGYIGVSNSEFVAAQLPYFVSGGLLGLFFLGAAGVLWLSSDLRDEWVKLETMDARLERIEQLMSIGDDELADAGLAHPAADQPMPDAASPPARVRRLARART